jgi:hypothetical protein
MLRKAIANQIKAHGETIEELEEMKRNGTLRTMGKTNVINSIMHYEGRAKEARSILRMIDDLELRVHADKCKHCGHHEIGVVDFAGKFYAVKPGQKILVRRTDVGDCKE